MADPSIGRNPFERKKEGRFPPTSPGGYSQGSPEEPPRWQPAAVYPSFSGLDSRGTGPEYAMAVPKSSDANL